MLQVDVRKVGSDNIQYLHLQAHNKEVRYVSKQHGMSTILENRIFYEPITIDEFIYQISYQVEGAFIYEVRIISDFIPEHYDRWLPSNIFQRYATENCLI